MFKRIAWYMVTIHVPVYIKRILCVGTVSVLIDKVNITSASRYVGTLAKHYIRVCTPIYVYRSAYITLVY